MLNLGDSNKANHSALNKKAAVLQQSLSLYNWNKKDLNIHSFDFENWNGKSDIFDQSHIEKDVKTIKSNKQRPFTAKRRSQVVENDTKVADLSLFDNSIFPSQASNLLCKSKKSLRSSVDVKSPARCYTAHNHHKRIRSKDRIKSAHRKPKSISSTLNDIPRYKFYYF